MSPQNIANIREYTDEMLSWVRGRGKIIIIVHDNPDPDCLASALALRHLLVMKIRTRSLGLETTPCRPTQESI